jgi:ankyrin repeat protein
VKVLLDAGAWPAMTDARGRTALWHGANQAQLAAVRQLAAVSPLDAADDGGTTALAAAAARGDEAVLEALLAAGADPTLASHNGNTALHVAAASAHAGSVALLAGRVPSLDAVNRHRDTALILAARSRCAECVRTLLAAGASPRLRNSDSLTAADVARLSGNETLAGLLD